MKDNTSKSSALLTDCSVAKIQHAIVNYYNYNGTVAVPNVSWGMFKGMECDLIMETDSGYLHEFEIKRSKSDFLADFKKKHFHDDLRIRYLTYVLPESMAGDWLKKFCEDNYKTFKRVFSFIFYYDCLVCGQLCARIHTQKFRMTSEGNEYITNYSYKEERFNPDWYFTDEMKNFIRQNDNDERYRRKIFLEERVNLYRLGCIRMWNRNDLAKEKDESGLRYEYRIEGKKSNGEWVCIVSKVYDEPPLQDFETQKKLALFSDYRISRRIIGKWSECDATR